MFNFLILQNVYAIKLWLAKARIQPFAFVSIFGFLPEVLQLYQFQSLTENFFPTIQHSLVCFQVLLCFPKIYNDD